jgi:16S rRNA (guanine966-N2)-methyltransferase
VARLRRAGERADPGLSAPGSQERDHPRVRVIAGTLGGRRLRAPAGRAVRPTSEKVREALFSMLGALEGASVLDLFAGTGALGIEALSRGAGSVVFVERDPLALEALRANLQALELRGPAARVLPRDALDALRDARARGDAYDLILVDPPYGRAGALERELQDLLPALLPPGGRVVVECDRRAPISLALEVQRERDYGDTSITIHTKR